MSRIDSSLPWSSYGKLAVLELHHLTFGQEGDLDRIFAGASSVGRPGALGFFL